MRSISLRKLLTSFCLAAFLFLSGCEMLDLTPSTTIEVVIIDESGDVSDCNIRIIEPDPSYWSNVYSKMVKLPGTNTHTFKEVEPGDYASLIGNISETYKEFSIIAGEQVIITYTYYNWGSITLGNAYSGYYTVPYYKWKCNISKK